jgi:hypothetical protein
VRNYTKGKGVQGAGAGGQGTVPTPQELDDEAERLEMDYNKHWYQYENFSLQEAFASQQARVESDWGTHERNLEVPYYHTYDILTYTY